MIDTLLFFGEALLATLMIAVCCSVVGVYVVLRRVVFVGAALAQLSSAGVALSLFLTGAGIGWGFLSGPLFLGFLFTLAGIAAFALRSDRHRVPADALLGAAFVVSGAAAVLLVASSATADIHELFFGGDVLFMSRADTLRLAGVTAFVLGLHVLLYKEFLFVSFDPEMAAASGFRVRAWNGLLYLTVGVVIAVAMASVGVLLVFAYLVLPGVVSLLLARRMSTVFVWAVVSGIIGTVVGFAASIARDLPTGPCIIVVLGLLALVASAFQLVRERAAAGTGVA